MSLSIGAGISVGAEGVIQDVSTLEDLEAIPGLSSGDCRYVKEINEFAKFYSGNQTARITADPAGVIWRPAQGVANGSSGAWEILRKAFPSIASLKLVASAAVGDRVKTWDYGELVFGGGAEYVAVADGTYTDGVGGQSADGSFLQGDGVQWAIVVKLTVQVKQFGATGDGVADDYTALQAAFNLAATISGDQARANSIPLATSNFPTVEVALAAGSYRVGSQVVVSAGRIRITGNNALLFANNGDIAEGYPLKFTAGYRSFVHGLSVGCAELGAVDVDAPNISGAAFSFSECNFLGNKSDDGLTVTGTAIRYSNQSSILSVDECQFHNVKHPIEQLLGDIVTFSKCWFDITASEITYTADTGYFNHIRDKFTVSDCIAASGPGDKGTRVAYFNCDNDVFLTIRGGRLGYEAGGGPLINWKVPIDLTNGTLPRSGFVIDGTTVAPRGQNESYYNRSATPLVRLYEMPNRATIVNIDWVNTIQGVLAPAPTTDLATLYADARAQLTLYSQTSYQYGSATGNEMYLAATTDEVEYKAWLELFNCTSYEFNTVSKGNASPHQVITNFDGARLRASYAGAIEVSFSTEGSGLSKTFDISFERDAVAGNVTAVVTVLSSTGPVGAGVNDFTVSAQFYDKVGMSYSASILDANVDDYYLALVLTKTGPRDLSVKNCTIIPSRSISISSVGSAGVPRQFFQLQS